jgi:signal transduction histidine kinase
VSADVVPPAVRGYAGLTTGVASRAVWWWGATGLTVASVAVAFSWQASTRPWWLKVPLSGWGALTILIGVAVWVGTRSSAIGKLIILAGASYYIGDLRASQHALPFAVGFCLSYLWVGVLGHLAVVWPDGRATTRLSTVLVSFCYAAPVGTQVIRFMTDDPIRPSPPWWDEGERRSQTAAEAFSSIILIMLMLAIIVVVFFRWTASTRLRRRPSGPVWTMIVATAVIIAAHGSVSVFGAPVELRLMMTFVAVETGQLGVLVVVLVRTFQSTFARWKVANVVLGLERGRDTQTQPPELQRALADALGDPTLTIYYPLEDGTYIDVHGRTAQIRQRTPDRRVTEVRRRGRLFALIEHDEALDDQRGLAEATVSIAGLAIERTYLYATLRKQVEEVEASRLRLATAAFEERRRIQRDLHDGSQQMLFAVLALLDETQHILAPVDNDLAASARAKVSRAHSQLGETVQALRHLTEGIYPTVLTEHGLAAAIEGLADLSQVPVVFDVPMRRWPIVVEVTAYFVINEAISNCIKHAAANQIRVSVLDHGDTIMVEVADDGRGGAHVRTGRGLHGLQDRVAALGGKVTVDSPVGVGTRVTACIPAHPG